MSEPTITPTRVNAQISDLFFNYDHTNARITGGDGMFEGYDNGELLENATSVLGCLERLGVGDLPDPSDLIRDFHDRL